jgi:hypothetical protein
MVPAPKTGIGIIYCDVKDKIQRYQKIDQ